MKKIEKNKQNQIFLRGLYEFLTNINEGPFIVDDECLLCNEKEDLSFEHVYPNCAGNKGQQYTKDIFTNRIIPNKHKYGIKYKVLCKKHNSDLGGKVNKHYCKIIEKIEKWEKLPYASIIGFKNINIILKQALSTFFTSNRIKFPDGFKKYILEEKVSYETKVKTNWKFEIFYTDKNNDDFEFYATSGKNLVRTPKGYSDQTVYFTKFNNFIVKARWYKNKKFEGHPVYFFDNIEINWKLKLFSMPTQTKDNEFFTYVQKVLS